MKSMLSLAGLFLGSTKTEILAAERNIKITQKSLLTGERVRDIPFEEVTSINVITIGGTSGRGSVTPLGRFLYRTFLIKIILKNGESISTGQISKSETDANELASSMARAIGCSVRTSIPRYRLHVGDYLIAIAGGVLIYLIWYRLLIGPWCLAMWFGTLPPVIMLGGFLAVLWAEQNRIWKYF